MGKRLLLNFTNRFDYKSNKRFDYTKLVKRSYNVLVLTCILMILAGGSFKAKAQCLPALQREKIANTNFFDFNGGAVDGLVNINSIVPATSGLGWTGSGGGVIYAASSFTQYTTEVANQTLNRTITDANLAGTGALVTITVRPSDGIPNANSDASTLNIIYNGVTYGRITTRLGLTTNATVVGLNGATPSAANIPGNTFSTIIFTLPATIPNTGSFDVQFISNSPSVTSSGDDFDISSVSFKSCPGTISGNVFNDNDGVMGGVNGTAIGFAGSPTGQLYVNLVSGGLVTATAAVAANGSYSLNTYVSGALTARLSTTQGTVGAAPPATTLPTGWSSVSETDNSADLSNTINIAATSTNTTITGINFGINLRPTTVNDVATCQTPGAATTINVLANDSDPNGGSLVASTISFPGGTDTDGDGDLNQRIVAGQGTWSVSEAGVVTFTPDAGFTAAPTPITYTVKDNAVSNAANAKTGLVSLTATITIPAVIAAPTVGTITQPTCSVSTGSVSLSGLPAGNWTITRNPGAIATNGTGTTTNISGLAPGNYTFTVTNSAGCTSATTSSVTINAQPATTATPVATTVQPTCSVSTGSVSVTTPVANTTYTLTGTNPVVAAVSNTTGNFTNVTTGSYRLTATLNGCTSQPATITINAQPATPATPVATTVQPTCSVFTGSVSVTTPVANTTYTLTGTNPVVAAVSNTTGNFTNVTTGSYSLTATLNGCTSQPATITINAQPATPATPVATTGQPTCSVSTGSVSVTTPVANTTYTLSGTNPVVAAVSNTTGSFTNVTTGSYSLTATLNGCTSQSATITINAQPATPATPVATTGQPTCSVSTGSVNVTTPVAGTTYTLTGTNPVVAAASNTTGNFTNVTTGSYSLTATLNGCTSQPATITINAQPATPATPVATTGQPTCSVSTGSVSVTTPVANTTYTLSGTNPVVAAVSNTTGSFTNVTTGSYSLTATLNGCTSQSATITINAQPATPATPVATTGQPTCSVSTGSVNVTTPVAGTTYTLTGTNPVVAAASNTTGNFTNVTTGSYSLTATLNGCTSQPATITINAQPATPATPVATTGQPTCSASTGSVNVTTPVAGTTYTLTGTNPVVAAVSNTTGNFTNVTTGSYSLTATLNGCTSQPATITINAQPVTPARPVATTGQPTCSVSTGSVNVTTPVAGTTYTLTGTNPVVAAVSNTTGNFTNVTTGSYSLTATLNGCTSQPTTITINAQPPTPTAPIAGTVTQPGCNTATGSVELSGLPTGNWTITSSTGTTTTGTGATTTISGLVAGSYTFTVKNDVGCTSTASTSVTINTQPATPAAPAVGTVIQPSCNTATGSVTLSGLPTLGTWTITTAPGGAAITGTGATTTISGLVAGSYTFTVTNASGCTSTASTSVTINAQPPIPTAPIAGTVTQPGCNTTTGSVELSGLPTGNWTITSSTGATTTGTGTTTTISGLTPGSYTFTITNDVGCTSTASASVNINTQSSVPVAPTVTATQPNCNTATGKITINAPTNPSFTYSIDGTNYQTAATFNAVAPGTYNVTVKNNNGCVSPATSITINAQPPIPDAPVAGTITRANCTVITGSVVINNLPSSGTWTLNRNPDNVSITGTGTSTTITGLSPGTYTFTVTNDVGCISQPSANVLIENPITAPELTFSKIDVDCFGATTGSINLNVTGGTAPYSYQWTGPNGFTSTDKDLMNLGGGVYNVTVTGGGNCTNSASITVTPVGPIAATPTVTNVTCFGGNNGAISLAVSGGTAPYTYAWSNGSTDKDPTGLVAGSYSVTITDSKNCTLNLQNITVSEPSAVPAPTAVVASQPSCSVTTGSVNISGLPNGTWTLTSSTGVVTTGTGASTTISNLTSGNYTFTVTNDAGCISPASAPVTINNQLSTPSAPVPAIPTQPTCLTATGTLELNGLPNGTWTITGTNGVVKTGNGTSTIIDELVPGTYTFTVVNSDGCSSTASAPVTINNQPVTPTAPIAAAPTQPTCTVATGSVELSGLPSGAWTVTTSNGGASTSGTGATVVINGLTPGTHIFTVTSSDGCTSAGSDPITINNQLSTPAVPTVDITQPTCTLSTGTITITAPTGATLEYSLDGGTYQSETVFKNVTAGTHNITSKDTNGGCTSAPATIIINQADCPGIVIAKAGVLSTDGNTINYTFTVTNTGNVTLKDVKVSDTKLGITDQVITIPVAGLAPGASATGTASYTLTQADRDAGKITNTATATATDPSGNPTTDSQSDDPNTPGVQNDPTVVLVTQTPAISITKAGVLSTDGNTINYTFTVTNTGNVTLKDVKVGDTKLGITDQVITIPAAGLAPGASATGTVTYNLTQADRDAGKVTNTATATGTDPSGNPTTDSQSDDPNTPGVPNDPTVVAVTQTPAISIEKAGVLGTDGNTINYTFTVTNTGNVTLKDVKVSDTKLGITDQVITIPAAGLAPGASATGTASYTLTQADRDAGKVTNTATATGTDPSGNPTTDSQSDDPNTPGVPNDPTVVTVKQNNPPVATASPIVTPQDTPVNDKITANDPDGDPLTYTVSTVPEHGTVNINPDGTYTYTYTPTPGYNGPDSFVTTVCDDKGACTTVTVPITVTPKPNNPPVATAPPIVTPQDTPINGKITANDPDGDPLTYTVSTVPEHGTVTINPDGTYTYTPTPGYNGPDSFVTTVCDDKGACTTVTVPITVTPKPNNPPVATAPPIVTPQDTPINGKITANDPDGDPLTYTVSTVPEHGTVTINPDGTYTYTPTPGYNGPDSFVTTVCDDKGACTTVTVPITVTPKPNNPPVATAPPIITPQDTPINGKITANDPDGDPLTYTVSTVPEHGTVTINPDGTYTYTPTTGYNGPDSFVTTVCDDKGACTTVTVPITVTPKPNNPPVASAPPVVTPQDTPINGKITANDPDGDPLTYNVSTVPEHGTVTINPDGTYTYTPTPGYNGPDSFVTTVCDDKGACTTVTVPITVTPKPNNPPVATAPPIVTPQDTPINGKITANDQDGDPLTYTVSTVPEHGTVTINPDGTYTYTPTTGYNGPDSFVTTVCDDKGACTTVTVPITVTPKPNNPPVASAPPIVTPQDTPINGKITANDPDGDPLTYTVSTVPEHGTVTINPDGTYTYTPTTGYNGPDSFVTTVCDDKGACTTVTVPITVTPKPNNPPVASAPPIVTPQDTPINGKITANDPDGDPLTYTVSTVPEHGTVTINPDGTYTYTPTPGYNGPDSFVTTVCDDKGACTTVTVPITVTPKPNNPPVATAPPVVTPQDTPVSDKVTANDPDGDPLTYTVSTVPEHGTVTINPDGTYAYTPTPGYSGPDSFVTTVCDDKGACTTVTVPITVTPKPNNPPVATAPPIVTPQDTPINSKITANDPDGDPLTYTVSTVPEHGTVTINPDGTYTYTPTPGYSGPDSFVTTVCDDKGACTTVTVPITVTPVLIANVSVVKTVDNATPVVGSNVTFTINVTNAGPNTATGVTATDPLPSGYTFVSVNAPAGTVYNSSTGIWTIGNLANGASMGLKITARVNATGNYANTAIVNAATSDPDVTNNRATATTVPVINKPIANNDMASSDANKPIVIQIIKDDNPGNSTFDLNSIEIVDQPKYGTVKINADGTVTYTPNPGYTGIDNFSYRLKDMFGNYTNVASVTIQLNAIALKIPNLFTPNGDGNNDTFEIIGLNQFAQNNLIIVNRWGNEVFHADNYQNNWTGEGLNEGTYYYLLKVKNNGDNGWTVYKGWLTLIRVFKK